MMTGDLVRDRSEAFAVWLNERYRRLIDTFTAKNRLPEAKAEPAVETSLGPDSP
jgi:hypothetical protein